MLFRVLNMKSRWFDCFSFELRLSLFDCLCSNMH